MRIKKERRDFAPGDYFWDADGDLNLVVETHDDSTGPCDQCFDSSTDVRTVYWPDIKIEHGLPAELPTYEDGGWRTTLHWEVDDEAWVVAKDGFKPVSDEEVAAVLASLGAGPPAQSCTCTTCPVHSSKGAT